MKKGILLVIAVLSISVFTGCRMLPGSSRAEEMQSMSNMRQVAVACHLFASKHDDNLPAEKAELMQYLNSGFDLSEVELVAEGRISDISDPDRTVLARSQTVSKNGKRAVAFVDGHCEFLVGN